MTYKYGKLQITQEDIDNGQRGMATTCAISRAVARTFGVRSVATTGAHFVRPEACFSGRTLQLEFDRARSFIRAFDAGIAVEPITLEYKEEIATGGRE